MDVLFSDKTESTDMTGLVLPFEGFGLEAPIKFAVTLTPVE